MQQDASNAIGLECADSTTAPGKTRVKRADRADCNFTGNSTMSAQESIIWEGSPSQVTNLGTYVVCVLLCFLIVPIFYAIWRWVETRCFRYTVSDQRIRVNQGVFSKRTDSIELYRIKDVVLLQPFWLRLFGLGNVELRTSDMTSPLLTIEAVPDPAALRERILLAAEARRDLKGVRELDVSERLAR
jgi:uncharacterized membrane protein YdbT with pleckstrin-like domain